MLQTLLKNFDKPKNLIFFLSIVLLFLLLTIAYKNDTKIKSSATEDSYVQIADFTSIKDFLFKKIKSPFTNISYEIKKGDSIQKILQKLEINNTDIQTVISQYNKYGSPSKLLTGNKIEIVIKKDLSGNSKNNQIIKFSVPVTKSTTIIINKNEEGSLISEKIITRLYKKIVVAENIILKNLYSSAIDAKMNPDIIIEFARIFGFEIDFQRDVRKMTTLKFYMKNILMKMVSL